MSNEKKKIRQRFRSVVFERDGHKCRMCQGGEHPSSIVASIDPSYNLDAHHITDRTLMPNQGYVLENGISLCPECHERAEVFHSTGAAYPGFAPEDLYRLIGSSYELAVKASKKLG